MGGPGVTSRHQLTPTATGAPARAGVRGCLPPMDAEPSSSRGQDPAVCRAGHPPRGGSSASAVNVMWRGGAVRCSPLLGHWWDPPEPPPPAGPGPDGSHAPRRRLRARPRRRRPHRDTVVIRTAGQRRQHAAYPESLCFGVTRAGRWHRRGDLAKARRTSRLAFQTRKSDAFQSVSLKKKV